MESQTAAEVRQMATTDNVTVASTIVRMSVGARPYNIEPTSRPAARATASPTIMKYIETNCRVLAGRKSDDSNDAVVRLAADDCELAKVLVQRDKHTLFRVRFRQNLFVARISTPLSSRITS
jgi:hypothetical protein